MSQNSSLLSNNRRSLFGMVHLGPVLNSHSRELIEVERQASQDALRLAKAGFDGIIIENFGDTPFYPDQVPPRTIAGMTRIGYRIRQELEQLLGDKMPVLGVNVLRNDAQAALAIAAAIGASFIRVNVHSGVMVTDQGILEGKAHITCRTRDQFHPECQIFADLRVKHSAPLVQRPFENEARELWKRAKADAIILTGTGTGVATDGSQLRKLRQSLPDCPLIAGSGVTPEQLADLLPFCNGLIVGTWLKEQGQLARPIDPERAKQLVDAVRNMEQKNRSN